MKIKIEFEASAPDFTKLAKRETNAQTRVRLIAMAQLKAGKTMGEVAESVGIERHSIGIWYGRYKKHGLIGLNDLPRPGAKPKLPKEKEEEFIRKIAALQASKDGGRITGYDIQKMALDDFGANYAEDSIYMVLKRLRISWITARSKHPKSDEEIQKKFKRDFKKKLLRSFPKKSI